MGPHDTLDFAAYAVGFTFLLSGVAVALLLLVASVLEVANKQFDRIRSEVDDGWFILEFLLWKARRKNSLRDVTRIEAAMEKARNYPADVGRLENLVESLLAAGGKGPNGLTSIYTWDEAADAALKALEEERAKRPSLRGRKLVPVRPRAATPDSGPT